MKKSFLFIFLFIGQQLVAQTYDINMSATVVKKYAGYNRGTILNIAELKHSISMTENPFTGIRSVLSETYDMILIQGQDTVTIPLNTRIDKALEFDLKTIDDLWNAAILQDVIPMLITNGTQLDLRMDCEQDALQHIFQIKSQGMEMNDPYLENYLYTLIAKIAPSILVDGRPGNVNILIEDNAEANAGMYPNGTLVINTGLLASLHSEAELVAILAHEVAHFVLDHHIENIIVMLKEQRRAEIAAAIATGLTAIAEGAAAYYSKGYYIPGAATVAVAAAGTILAQEAAKVFGMKYSQKQEYEADDYSKQVLNFLNYDENALASALNRLKQLEDRERNRSLYFNSATHPALISRIERAGIPSEQSDKNFEKKISFAVTNSAYQKYENRRFKEALELARQNIDNHVATADDYLIAANCMLALYGDNESNTKVMEMIKQAKQIDPQNINIYKVEILSELRLNNKEQATTDLSSYISFIDSQLNELKNVNNEEYWGSLYEFFTSEEKWAQRMLIKLRGMQ